jgi:hypothetical protein
VRPSCFRLVKISWCQVSVLSRWRPRYLTWSALGSCTLFMWTGWHIPVRVVNVTWTNLSAMPCMCHLWSRMWMCWGGSGISGKLWLGHCPLWELLSSYVGLCLSPFGIPGTIWSNVPYPDDTWSWVWSMCGLRIGRENRRIMRKSSSVPLCPPQIPHDLIWDRIRATGTASRRLTAWAMAESNPKYVMYYCTFVIIIIIIIIIVVVNFGKVLDK